MDTTETSEGVIDSERANRLLAAQLVGLAVFLVMISLGPRPPVRGLDREEGVNLIVAKSLSLGSGLRLVQLPGAPSAHGVQPALPMVMSVFGRMWPRFPDNLALMRIFQAACLAFAAALMVWIAGRGPIPLNFAVLAALMGFLSLPVVGVGAHVVPQPMFLLLVSISLAAVMDSRGSVGTIIAGGLAGLGAFTLDLGFLPGAAICVGLFAARDTRRAVEFGITALVVVGFGLLTGWLGAGSVDPVLFAGTGVAGAWSELVDVFADLVGPGVVSAVLAAMLIAAAILGAWRSLRDQWLIMLPIATMVFGTALGPSISSRHILVFLPWIMLFAAAGVRWLWAFNAKTRVPVGMGTLLLILGIGVPSVRGLVTRDGSQLSQQEAESVRLLISSVAQETPDDAVVASDVDFMLHLHAGRLSVPLLSGRDEVRLPSDLCAAGATRVGVLVPAHRPTLGALVAPVYEFTGGSAHYDLTCP